MENLEIEEIEPLHLDSQPAVYLEKRTVIRSIVPRLLFISSSIVVLILVIAEFMEYGKP